MDEVAAVAAATLRVPVFIDSLPCMEDGAVDALLAPRTAFEPAFSLVIAAAAVLVDAEEEDAALDVLGR
jgi:hypothetical protein